MPAVHECMLCIGCHAWRHTARATCRRPCSSQPRAALTRSAVTSPARGAPAKRSLGQNFMTDENTLAKIVAAVDAGEGDLFLEIGPGRGALTAHLLQAGSTVLAIEKDTALAASLKEKLSCSSPRFEVLEGDILQADMPALLQRLSSLYDSTQRAPGQNCRCQPRAVANLPFNITSEVIHNLLRLGDHISHVHLLLEDDTAKRLVRTQPGDSRYRAINILVQYYSTPKYHFKVPRTVFQPRPHVDAALTSFALRPSSERTLAAGEEKQLDKLIEIAFRSKRKRLRNALQPAHSLSAIDAALQDAGLQGDAKAVDLSAQDFAALCRQLHSTRVFGLTDERVVSRRF